MILYFKIEYLPQSWRIKINKLLQVVDFEGIKLLASPENPDHMLFAFPKTVV